MTTTIYDMHSIKITESGRGLTVFSTYLHYIYGLRFELCIVRVEFNFDWSNNKNTSQT